MAFTVVRVRVPTHRPGSVRLEYHWCQGREHADFLTRLPRCGEERGEEVMGLESCQQSNIENGVRLYHTIARIAFTHTISKLNSLASVTQLRPAFFPASLGTRLTSPLKVGHEQRETL